MTTKPTIEANKGLNSTLSSTEWNTNCLQGMNYLFEVLAGSNADKIPGSALTSPLVLVGKTQLTPGSGIAPTAANWEKWVDTGLFLYSNIPTGAGGWKWYFNGTLAATLDTAGNLTLAAPAGLKTSGGPTLAFDAGASSGHAVNATTGTISFATNFNGRVPQVMMSCSQGTVTLASVSATGFTVTQAGGAGTYALYWFAAG